jgi:hypothetical protein
MCLALLYRKRARSNLRRDRKQHRAIGSVLGRLCPKSKNKKMFLYAKICYLLSQNVTHLHCHHAIINNNFLCQEISADCGLVLIAESLIYVLVHQ